jgi:hypothetical protein
MTAHGRILRGCRSAPDGLARAAPPAMKPPLKSTPPALAISAISDTLPAVLIFPQPATGMQSVFASPGPAQIKSPSATSVSWVILLSNMET